MPGTHCWRWKWRAAVTSILSARCCCWFLFAALGRRWRTVAALAFGLAVAVKFLPIVLLPLYWKRVRIRDAALAAVVVGLLYVPFLNHGRIPIGSLGTYVQSFRFNDPVFAMLERVAAPQLVVGLAVLVGFLTAIWMRRKSADVVCGRICVADGSIASVCTGRISVVPALAAAVPAVGLDGADHHLDGQHHPDLLRLASARTWPSVVASWLDYAAGIWGSRRDGCSHLGAAPEMTRCRTELNIRQAAAFHADR